MVLLANKVDLDTSEEGFENNNKAKLDKFCEEFGFIGWLVFVFLCLYLYLFIDR